MNTAQTHYKHVLAATDSSERGAYVLRVAASLAQQWKLAGTAIRMVHVPADLPTSQFNLRPSEVEEALKGRGEYELSTTLKEMALDWDRKVVVGIPWDGICRAAAELDHPLTVIGSHGYQILDRFLGTTASRVVNHISSSVLVARPTPEIDRGVRHILVGLDDSKRAPGVLAAALEFAQTFGGEQPAQLTALRVAQIPELAEEIPASGESLMSQGRTELAALVRDLPNTVKINLEVRDGRPWRVLLQVADEIKPDLIVIGSHGYDTIDHLVGTNAARVADRSPCSVLVVK